jgi:hypothetical protein
MMGEEKGDTCIDRTAMVAARHEADLSPCFGPFWDLGRNDMRTETIPITVDSDAADRFCEASPDERRKLELLLRLRLRELTLGRVRPLKEIMDEIGREAEAKGLTPEKLESMLRDE